MTEPEQAQLDLPEDLATLFRIRHYPRWLVNAIAMMQRCLDTPGWLAADGPRPPAVEGVPTEARLRAAKAIIRRALVDLDNLLLSPDIEHPD